MFDTTPLSNAVRDASLDIRTLLFDNGGSKEYGELLHWAIFRPSDDCLDGVKLILRKGAPINLLKYQNDKSSWSWRKPFNLGTPLHTAARIGKVDIVEELLSNGADPFIRDSCGELALETALDENHGLGGANAAIGLRHFNKCCAQAVALHPLQSKNPFYRRPRSP